MLQQDNTGGTREIRKARRNRARPEVFRNETKKTFQDGNVDKYGDHRFAFTFRDPSRSQRRERGRYEYRVWPRTSHPAIAVLHKHWRQVAAERRSDIYLLHPATDRRLIKLRNGIRLEIKLLGLRTGTVEYWKMPLSCDFPLTGEARWTLSEALRLRHRLPMTAGNSAAHLLAALDQSILPLTVRKSRLLFRSTDCQAEICHVSTNDWSGQTIALEASDIPMIAAAIDALQLGSLPNCSYGDALRCAEMDGEGAPSATRLIT